jgi:hypothetical protein
MIGKIKCSYRDPTDQGSDASMKETSKMKATSEGYSTACCNGYGVWVGWGYRKVKYFFLY